MIKILSIILLCFMTAQSIADEKPSSGITASEFSDLTDSAVDNKVIQFRKGSDLYTMIPMRDWWFTEKRKEAFEAAELFSQKLMSTWLANAFGIQIDDPLDLVRDVLEQQSAEKIREVMRSEGLIEKMPSAKEIVQQATSARYATGKLIDRAKFMVSFDELIDIFDKNQDEILEFSGIESARELVTPTAFMFVLGAKVPYELVKFVENIKYVGGLAPLLRGSLTMSLTVRPWFVTRMNLDTGAKEERWYFESSSQIWLFKDLGAKKQIWNNHYRYGAGLLWGDFAKMGDISGFTAGGSINFNLKNKADANGDNFLPYSFNIKYGTITAAAQTMTQVMDFREFLKHGYFMVTRQSGIQAPLGRGKNAEIGYAANIRSVTDKITIDQETLDELTKEIGEVIPGAEILYKNNKLSITVPATSIENPSSTKKNSTNLDPKDSSNQDTENSPEKTDPPKHDKSHAE